MDGEQNNTNIVDGQNTGGSAGPVIGIIVILVIILLGGLYFWNQRAEEMMTDEDLNSINSQSDSDETNSIEADLESTDVDNLDSEFNAS